jgi:hypothetical protein
MPAHGPPSAAAIARTVTSHRASVAAQAQARNSLLGVGRVPGVVGVCGVLALGVLTTVGSPASMLDNASAWTAGRAATGYSSSAPNGAPAGVATASSPAAAAALAATGAAPKER